MRRALLVVMLAVQGRALTLAELERMAVDGESFVGAERE